MKKIETDEQTETLQSCHRCGQKEVVLYHSEKVEGYLVGECPKCGAYSEIIRADVFEKFSTRKPRKTGDPEEPWISRLRPRQETTFIDKKETMIQRIYSKIRKKR